MITVIIPTHNSARTIERAVVSALSQAVETEIIVADDGSTDMTVEICRRLGVEKIIQRETCSGGPNWGRNAGLSVMTGDWFMFLDHDDELEPGVLKEFYILTNHPNANLIFNIYFGSYWFIKDGSKKKLIGRKNLYCKILKKNTLFRRVMTRDNLNGVPYLSGMLISAEMKHIRFEENFGRMDYDYMLRLTEGQRALQIHAPVMTRYSHGGNLSLDPQFRREAFYHSLLTLEGYYKRYPKWVLRGMMALAGTKARYHYLMSEHKMAWFFFRQARLTGKTLLYLVTSLLGLNRWVGRYFKVLGT